MWCCFFFSIIQKCFMILSPKFLPQFSFYHCMLLSVRNRAFLASRRRRKKRKKKTQSTFLEHLELRLKIQPSNVLNEEKISCEFLCHSAVIFWETDIRTAAHLPGAACWSREQYGQRSWIKDCGWLFLANRNSLGCWSLFVSLTREDGAVSWVLSAKCI